MLTSFSNHQRSQIMPLMLRRMRQSSQTSRKAMSPLLSVPRCTVNDCFCIRRLAGGFKSTSFACYSQKTQKAVVTDGLAKLSDSSFAQQYSLTFRIPIIRASEFGDALIESRRTGTFPCGRSHLPTTDNSRWHFAIRPRLLTRKLYNLPVNDLQCAVHFCVPTLFSP